MEKLPFGAMTCPHFYCTKNFNKPYTESEMANLGLKSASCTMCLVASNLLPIQNGINEGEGSYLVASNQFHL